jgi:hypothetical protein
MEELINSASICFQGLQDSFNLSPEIGNQCLRLTEAIDERPWILSEFPYPLTFSLVQAMLFHGTMLLLTRLFTLGL